MTAGSAVGQTELICRCGHPRRDHLKAKVGRPGYCRGLVLPEGEEWGRSCPCLVYDDAVLPTGERLEFGRHRIPSPDAETAPAWPKLR